VIYSWLLDSKFYGTAVIGEITTSGYFGSIKGNFHSGGVRKLAEIFGKLYIISQGENKSAIIKLIREIYPGIIVKSMSCHFIVPKNSLFIKSLGYRKQLFETGFIKLDEIPLSKEKFLILAKVYNNAKNESLNQHSIKKKGSFRNVGKSE
jgi:hypothetical protein